MSDPDPSPVLDRKALALPVAGARLGDATTLGALVEQRTLLIFLRHRG